jgi:hypothetical protein
MNYRMNRNPRSTWSEREVELALRSLPAPVAPPGLTTALRVLASKERARRKLTFFERCAEAFERMRFAADTMMRPVALPFAGGLFSAVALFSMWVVPTYPLRADHTPDIPTMLTTQAAIKGMVPIGVASGGEAVVDVTIDDQGRMLDYKVVAGAAILANPTLRRRLENTLLFTEFIPATAFGKPTISRVRVSLGLSHIDVKG